MQESEIFNQLSERTPKIKQAFTPESTVNVSLNLNYDWYNGFYLHVSGSRAEELMEDLKRCTYKVLPWQATPVSIAHGEALCTLRNFQTSVGSAPDFPRMEHVSATFAPELSYDATTASIPLLLNLYGSDLGHGIPVVALMFQRIEAVFSLSEPIICAIRDGELRVVFVALENGFAGLQTRKEHVNHTHRKEILTLDEDGHIRPEIWCITDGMSTRMPVI